MKPFRLLVLFGLTSFALSCQPKTELDLSVDFEKYTLQNGLDVVFHVDRSDPVVAVAMTYHVGSAREREGKTGFAHLFEHLLFLDSENLGPGGLDILMNNVGGMLNGSTNRDRTNYFQVVPNDALEKILWAEADKMGFFINTVTESVVAKEKQVVKNEKRQSVDNQPYGHTNYIIDSNLYPASHPYNWQVIGSLEDLQSATLGDVHTFYRSWYGPNNATLVVAGDFDQEQARAWIEKYFGEIPSIELPPSPELVEVELSENMLYYHEDNFASLPELTMAWPAVEQYHPDAYPLSLLSVLLSEGKKAPFYKVLVEETNLAPDVSMYHSAGELAGKFSLRIRAFQDTDLDSVYAAVQQAFDLYEAVGFSENDLKRVKAGFETDFYNGISSVLGKAFQMAQYNIFAGSPAYLEEDIVRILSVSLDDIDRVYRRYIKDQPFIATCFVPMGQRELVLEGSAEAAIVEERINSGVEEQIVMVDRGEVERTPSSFDRSVEPPAGQPSEAGLPLIWHDNLANGLNVMGINNDEIPIVQFAITLRGGLLLDDLEKVGIAYLMSEVMNFGTAEKTPEELEEAIETLGASIRFSTGQDQIVIHGNTLARNFDKTMALVEEMMLEPRWDDQEFELAKQRTINRIRQDGSRPNAIATQVFNRLLYGKDHILSKNVRGDLSSVERITIEDLRTYYNESFSSSAATFHVVGDITQSDVISSLSGLEARWGAHDVTYPSYPMPDPVQQSKLYFVDVPGSKQSVVRVGYLALAQTNEDYYPATVMNYRLGGGGFASQILQVLREQKGYTYGARSSFSGSLIPGPFSIATSVRSNATFDTVFLIKDILEYYEAGFTASDLEATTNYLLRSNARAFETLGAKINMLQNISAYGLPDDYIRRRESTVREMTVERIQTLARKYIDAGKMIYLIVGDAETQLAQLREIGFGEPILLDREGNPIGEE